MTAQNGGFRLEVAPGQYRVQITHLGYQPQTREVALAAGAPTADLGTVQLDAAAVAIEGVMVEAKRPTVHITATADVPGVRWMLIRVR